MFAISDNLVESLACLRNSEGFIVSITVIERMANMARTTNSSISVKDLRSFTQEWIRERERERERERVRLAGVLCLTVVIFYDYSVLRLLRLRLAKMGDSSQSSE
ncbi:MAG: hypothetical protein A3B13_03755 [Candidatus Liptonbacteria bacterium RIFCSPLOWO2_01_FULL_45_15]|uniref:Uncharacterized protein n=1 Tax=Candidatus Liptonbacteria bacterium RIFCSPLOWO2_01_FULL_45_15 TaxID=1798649 RepID=A0A1G2CIE1_9BACT|nr:MAG: hypothetical protein A3B13_03755 [Candidatus Liptonbacteria bacterium RIFCSPLOWO2_01_FULL_45_15]